jgi:predicted DNA-binding transcriptional regulator AlpA
MAGLPPKLADQFAYPPRGMDTERAASYVEFGRTKFLEMVDDGRMPKPIDVDGSPRWDRVELDAAFEDLKERRKDPVQRGRDRIHDRLRQQQREGCNK